MYSVLCALTWRPIPAATRSRICSKAPAWADVFARSAVIGVVDKGCIFPFPKKGDLRLAKNYRGITLTPLADKIYNALLRNRIEPKIDSKKKNQNGFRRNRSTTSQILTIRRILKGVRAKNLEATILFVDFTKAFDSIHRRKMEQILSLTAYQKKPWQP